MTKQDVKIFYRFLKEYGLFSSWFHNIKDVPKTLYYIDCNDYDDYIEYTKAKEIIVCSFYFSKTKEGYHFWIDINNKWVEYYNKYKKK